MTRENLSFSRGKIGLLASIVAMSFTLSSAQTLVYCSEASPESFNPQLVSSGAAFDANSVPIFNRLVEFKLGTTELKPALAEAWDVSDDGKVYTFHLKKGVQFHSNTHFKPTRAFNADDVLFSFQRQMDTAHPYHNVSSRQYEYFESMGLCYRQSTQMLCLKKEILQLWISFPLAQVPSSLGNMTRIQEFFTPHLKNTMVMFLKLNV